jgi:hypothetical protein
MQFAKKNVYVKGGLKCQLNFLSAVTYPADLTFRFTIYLKLIPLPTFCIFLKKSGADEIINILQTFRGG